MCIIGQGSLGIHIKKFRSICTLNVESQSSTDSSCKCLSPTQTLRFNAKCWQHACLNLICLVRPAQKGGACS